LSNGLIALYIKAIDQVSLGKVRIWHRRTHYKKLRSKLSPNKAIFQQEDDLEDLLKSEKADAGDMFYY